MLVGKLREIIYVCVEITHHKDVSKVQRSSGGLVKVLKKKTWSATASLLIKRHWIQTVVDSTNLENSLHTFF